jgi:uncharacterized cupredoxin-like copper-binding protein
MPASRSVIALRALVAAGSIIAVAACGGSPAATGAATAGASPAASAPASSPAASTDTGSPSASASASVAPSGSASTGNTIALTGQEYSFSGPAEATAGVTTITLQNAGKEEHQAQLVKLNEGKAFGDLTAALAGGDPSAALALVTVSGGPNLVQPGATGQTTQNLEPGNYAFLCFISGADNIPHVAKGMIQPLTVTGTASSDTTLPAGDATVAAKDFSFDIPTPVAAGEHTFTFTNNGPQPHEAGLLKLTGGATVDQLKAMFTASPAPSGDPGPPPWEEVGGITAIAPGTSATFTANLEAGQQYAFICFVPDPATGKAHAELGMIGAIPTK